MSTTTATGSVVPSGRFFFSNHGLPVEGGAPGESVSVFAMGKESPYAWNVEAVDGTPASPGKQSYVLCTAKDNYFLAIGNEHNTHPIPWNSNQGIGPIEIPSYNATTTADKTKAWNFVLDGDFNNGTFEGKLVSPDGLYTLGLYGDIGDVYAGYVFMSTDPKVDCADQWKLQLALLGEKQE